MRIVVAGSVAAAPLQAGAAWAVLQYVHGFADLGHDVLLVEEADGGSEVERYFDDVTARHGLGGRAALVTPLGSVHGMSCGTLRTWLRSADVLINLAGVLRNHDLLGLVRRRVYVDLDPGFTQCWSAADGIDMNFKGHDVFVTVGLSIGDPACSVPTCQIEWEHTVPPVALSRWPIAEEPPTRGITTVGNWRSYGSTSWDGVDFRQKAHTMRTLVDLPGRVPGLTLEPALSIHDDDGDDRASLTAHGWLLHDPRTVAGRTDTYQSFVRSSTAELGVVKAGYVASRSGWFSDRTACYLASGRPAVVQDTGWSRFLPSSEGLLSYDDAAGAADALREVAGNYTRHRTAARAVAEEHLDASHVLPRLLGIAGV